MSAAPHWVPSEQLPLVPPRHGGHQGPVTSPLAMCYAVAQLVIFLEPRIFPVLAALGLNFTRPSLDPGGVEAELVPYPAWDSDFILHSF